MGALAARRPGGAGGGAIAIISQTVGSTKFSVAAPEAEPTEMVQSVFSAP